jgi:hypothetical protein
MKNSALGAPVVSAGWTDAATLPSLFVNLSKWTKCAGLLGGWKPGFVRSLLAMA